MIKQKIVTVFGGTGFIGSQIVNGLAQQGYLVKVATRYPESVYFLKPCGAVGQVVAVACNYSDPKSIAAAVKNSSYVINSVGILNQSRKNSFKRIHVEVAESIAKACKKQGVEKFIHISALGAEKGTSKYFKSKAGGEKAVRKAFPKTTILRPSIVFGAGDRFFNMFAHLTRYLPVMPLIGGGNTKFQPVYVGDIAAVILKILSIKDNDRVDTYELGGPDVVTFKEMIGLLFDYTERKRPTVSLPWFYAKSQALFMGMLPNPYLTCDQVESLKTDTVVSKNALKINDLDIASASMGLVLPTYLECYCTEGHYKDKKHA